MIGDEEIKERIDSEYEELLAIVMTFLQDLFNNPGNYPVQTDLMELKSLKVLNYAFEGYGLTFEEAIDKMQLQDTSLLTQEQLDEREMLINLSDNLINFSVAGEHQMLEELQQVRYNNDSYDSFLPEALKTVSMFNKTYAKTENADILFALSMAAKWVKVDNNEIMEFKTQEDERVRDSHAAVNGLRYRKRDFPPELVPPIDWSCRCRLINTGTTDGRKLTNKGNVDEIIKNATNPAFKYNVATSGVMFSEEHPYFDIDASKLSYLQNSVIKIKRRLGL